MKCRLKHRARRHGICLCLFGLWLIPGLGWANPCEDASLSADTAQLYQRLEQSPKRSELEGIAQTAETLFTKPGDTQSRACIAYISGSAYLIMSSARSSRQMNAFRATQWFALSQSLNAQSMDEPQAQGRLKAAWVRLGRQRGWLTSQQMITVELPKGHDGDILILIPPTDRREELCLDRDDCIAEWTFPLSPDRTSTVAVRPGTYTVGLQTECGRSQLPSEFVLTGGALPRAKDPVCNVELEVLHAGKPLTEWQILNSDGAVVNRGKLTTESGKITVKAKGMIDTVIEMSRDTKRTVSLEKCLLNIQVDARPGTAKIVGAGVRPWGKFDVTASHPGYADYTRTLKIPAPERCTNVPAIHPIKMELARRIVVQSVDDRGDTVSAPRITIAGAPRDPLGFTLLPGQYRYVAQHPTLEERRGDLFVPHCKDEDCGPLGFKITFKQPPNLGDSLLGPRGLYVVSGLLLVGSGIAGASASQADERLSNYTVKREEIDSVASLDEHRKNAAFTSDVLLVSSGVTFLAGYLWSTWETEE